MSNEEKKYELSDLNVVAVGLVGKGAIGEEFFLMKSEDGEPEEIDEVTEAVKSEGEGFWKRLEGVFTRFFKSKEDPKPDPPAEVANEVVAKEVTMPEDTKTETTAEVKAEVVAEKEVEVVSAVVEKKEEGLAERVALLEKDLAETKDKLSVTEQKASEVERANAELTYLEKAKSFGSLPTKPEDLAKHLSVISKADAETVQYFLALLDAVNKMASDAGLFREFGTSRVPPKGELGEQAEQIAKEKKVPYREALLDISPDKQAEILTKRQIELSHK